jgi:2-polyprenyl-3-methyl-5-hydroxy-6-metoxy-1,4-benzoquinol methylase
MADFEPRTYWTDRLAGGGIGKVGRLGLSDELNATGYRIVRRHAVAMLRKAGVDTGGRALDVGTGWGFWLRSWHALGFGQVDAVDFVEESLQQVRSLAKADDDLRVADIAAPNVFADRQPYQLVSCMNVLLHVVDDDAFAVALANVASAVAPGGLLLLAEPAATGPTVPVTGPVTSKIRPLADYRNPLADAGLQLIAMRPALSITGDPVEIRSGVTRLAHRLWWRWVLRLDRIRPLRTPLSWVVQVVDEAARRFGAAETGKLLLFRR